MSDAQGSAQAGNPANGAGASTGTTGAVTQDWTSGFDDNTRGIIQTKGWKGPADVVGSYANLEKLLGADKAGRGVVVPRDDATAEEWATFHNKLGRPETPDGYKLAAPDGDTGEFAKTASTWFHEAGLTSKQASALSEKWNQHVSTIQQQQQAEFEQKSAIEMQELQNAWGPKFNEQAELARRARREAGLTDDEGVAIERALGLKKAAEVFAFLGKQFAEAPVKGGEGAMRGSFGATPEDARARISALKNDAGWTAKYLNGDADARAEFDRLHRIAFPGAE